MRLRKYQQEIVDYIDASVAFGSNKLMVEAPTGSGKTVIIGALCNLFKKDRIVISANVSKIIHQIANHIDDCSLLKSGSEEHFDATKRVQVVMEQTWYSRRDSVHLDADIVIRDEGHIGTSGDRFTELIEKLQPRVEIGFSATPYDKDGVALPGYEVVQGPSVKELTRDGYLMPADTYVTRFGYSIDLSNIGKNGEYSEPELDSVLNNEDYNTNVAEAYLELGKGQKAIAFVSGIQHAEDLAAKMREKGIRAAVYHSKMTQSDRDYVMQCYIFQSLLNEERIDVLVSVSSLTTGFDFPDCNVVLNCRPTKVRSLYVQMMGRVLRPVDDQTQRATIIDCCQATKEHGLYDEPFKIHKTKEAAKGERAKRSEPVIDYMFAKTSDKYIMVDKHLLGKALDRVKKGIDVESLIWRFENSCDIHELLGCSADLYDRFYGGNNHSKIPWILEDVEPAMSWMSLNTIRNRLRKMIKDGKKFGGIKSYPDWFRRNVLKA